MWGRITLSSLICVAAFAQAGNETPPAPAAEPQARINVQVNEVIVPVTVTDEKGRFVTDLDQKDFEIYEEGQPQQIRFFTRERNQPVVIGFLLDLSNTARLQWKTFQDASEDLVTHLLPGDPKYSGYLITYATEAELAVNTTSDSEKLLEKIRKTKPGGGAALYDAIYTACTRRDLVKGEPIEPRRVIVIVGDGHDNASKHTLDEVLELAQRNLVTIYGVSTVSFGFTAEGERNLKRLCNETGGRVEYPLQGVYKDVAGYLSTPSDEGNYAIKVGTGGYTAAIANGIYTSIANVAGEVTTQYILRYVPRSTDTGGQFRRIQVRVNVANVEVRARTGYYPHTP